MECHDTDCLRSTCQHVHEVVASVQPMQQPQQASKAPQARKQCMCTMF